MRNKPQVQKEKLPPPNACLFCYAKEGGVYTSLPVYLHDGKKLVGIYYRAQCPVCRHVRVYEDKDGYVRPGVYKLNGKTADFRAEFWPELKLYGIDPAGFVNVLFKQSRERYFDVSQMPKLQSRHDNDLYEPKTREHAYGAV